MNYLVLARKWRPQNWEDVVAQEHVTVTLRNAIAHNRLAHAYLFAGPRGVGKTSAARILAKSLNCEKAPTIKPCNRCSSCVEIAESRNIDVLEINGASNRGIDDIRNLQEKIAYAPVGGQTKVFIIDEVHMLTREAFNALLKTLEEPPGHVLFILATTEPHKVPLTILSRCQRFDFHLVPVRSIAERLKEICQEENIEITDEALALIAKKAGGSIRDSQSILDQLIPFSDGKITLERVMEGLGLIREEIFVQAVEGILSRETARSLDEAERVVTSGLDVEEFLNGLAEHFRNLLVVRSTGSTDLIDAAAEEKKQWQESAVRFAEEDLVRLVQMATEAAQSAKRSIHPRLVLELALVKMTVMDRTVRIEDLLTRLDRLAGSGDSQPVVPKPDPPAVLPQSPKTNSGGSVDPKPSEGTGAADPGSVKSDSIRTESLTGSANPGPSVKNESTDPQDIKQVALEDVRQSWDEIVRAVKHRKITVGSFLQDGLLERVADNTVEIAFGMSDGFHIDTLLRCKEMILEVMRDILKAPVTFRCVQKDITKNRPGSSTRAEKEKNLKQWSEQHPTVKKFLDDFDTEIVH